ncbi:MAG: Cohesin protein, partial [Candidatus Berkelbacteria bacterium]|nr:Cohesin protein [Candidatus Berkelbacteria bacterium]
SSLTAKWNLTDIAADINEDGVVNTIDFAILNSNWFVSGT